MELEELLARSAPQVAPRTVEVHSELRALARAAEPSPRRRARRIALSGAAAAVVLAGGTAAATGAVGVPGFLVDKEPGNGCSMQFDGLALPVAPGPDGDVGTRPEQARALAAERAWLKDFDLATIDRAAAVDAYRREWERDNAILAPADREHEPTGNMLESLAMSRELRRQLVAYLDQNHIVTDNNVLGIGITCDD